MVEFKAVVNQHKDEALKTCAESYFKWVQNSSSYLLVHFISEDQKNDSGKGPVKYFRMTSTTQVVLRSKARLQTGFPLVTFVSLF